MLAIELALAASSSSVYGGAPILRSRRIQNITSGATTSDLSSGWYYVHDFNDTYPPEDRVQCHWYFEYLSISDLDTMHELSIEVRRLQDSEKLVEEAVPLSEATELYVKCSLDFDPSSVTSANFSWLGKSHLLVSSSNLTATAAALSAAPGVALIIPKKPTELFNRYAGGYIFSPIAPSFDGDYFRTPRTLYNLGLTGQGQVVGLIDSGIDVNHTFFYDTNMAFNKVNTMHRKIAYYDTLVDNYDGQSGHGTHVAGILAGKAECTDEGCGVSNYNGIAEDARIHFFDCGEESSPSTISIPNPEYIAECQPLTGFSILSNSWGQSSHSYILTEVFDEFAYEMNETLVVFAAGNSYDYDTVGSPADCKNVLTVGDSELLWATKYESSSLRHYYINSISVSLASYSVDYWSDMISNRTNSIINASSALYSSSFSSEFAIFKSSDTNACTEMKSINVKGAVIYEDSGFQYCTNVSFPIFLTSDNSILSLNSVTVTPSLSSSFSTNDEISASSSKGPTYNGLLKPDVSAPGYQIISSKSSGSTSVPNHGEDMSGLLNYTGTSMSTPLISGALAIIRQYFTDGFYPSGTNNSEGIIPHSTLLKSMIVNSAVPPDESDPSPTDGIGYGIPSLLKGLGIKGGTVGIRVVNGFSMPFNSHYSANITTTSSSGPLSVTLSYFDLPTTEDSGIPLLIDVNLVVVSPSGSVYFGNQRGSEDDHFSNLERVYIAASAVEIGVYQIHLMSSNLSSATDPIALSLVASGPFSQSDYTSNPIPFNLIETSSCVSNCWGKGTCGSGGMCVCDSDRAGRLCQIGITEATVGSTFSFSIDPHETLYTRFYLPSSSNNFSISTEVSSSDAGEFITVVGHSSCPLSLSDSYAVEFSSATSDSIVFNLSSLSDFPDATYVYVLFHASYASTATGQAIIRVDSDTTGIDDDTSWIQQHYVLFICLMCAAGLVVLALIVFVSVMLFRRRKKKSETEL